MEANISSSGESRHRTFPETDPSFIKWARQTHGVLDVNREIGEPNPGSLGGADVGGVKKERLVQCKASCLLHGSEELCLEESSVLNDGHDGDVSPSDANDP